MTNPIERARVSHDGYVLEFPSGFRGFGLAVSAIGLLFWLWLYLEWRAVGGLGSLQIDAFLVVRTFTLPFGVGLLVWSSQKIAVVEDRISSLHLGRIRELDRTSARIQSVIPSGVYVKDANGKRLFVSRWLVDYPRLRAELGRGSE